MTAANRAQVLKLLRAVLRWGRRRHPNTLTLDLSGLFEVPPAWLSRYAGNVARIGHRLLLEALAEHDLRLAHFAVLAALADFGPLGQHELADCLDINRSHLVGYADHVEQRGLVARPRPRRPKAPASGPHRGWPRAPSRSGAGRRAIPVGVSDALSRSERATLASLLRRVLDANDEARLAEGRQV